MAIKPLLFYLIILYTVSVNSQSCNCDITLTNLKSSSLNLIWASNITYSPGDVICIPAGNYSGFRFYDFEGSATQPLTIKNCGGKVVITESMYSGISFQRSKYIHLTGTGDENEAYGIEIAGTGNGSMGIYVENLSSDIEIDNIEISNAGFAGIMAKTDPQCSKPLTWRSNGFVLKNLNIHHNYIHNTGGEGIYVGFTGGYKIKTNRSCSGTPIFGHWLENIDIHHNVLEFIGWDGIQLNLVHNNGKIRDNYISNYGLENVYYQNFAMSIGGGEYEVNHNFILNGLQEQGRGIQIISGESGTKVFDNVFLRPKLHGIFLHNRHVFDDVNDGYYITNNTIIEPENSGVFYNTKITETNDPSILYNSQDVVSSYFTNNLIVDPGNDYEGGNTWKQNQESYFDFNNRSNRDSLLQNIVSNIMTREADTLGLTNILNGDYSQITQLSDLYDINSNISTWGTTDNTKLASKISKRPNYYGASDFQFAKMLPSKSKLLDQNKSNKDSRPIAKETVIYPNPTNSSFQIRSKYSKNPIVELITMDGKILYNTTYSIGTPISVQNYTSGLYFVRIISKEKSEIHKLIIQ